MPEIDGCIFFFKQMYISIFKKFGHVYLDGGEEGNLEKRFHRRILEELDESVRAAEDQVLIFYRHGDCSDLTLETLYHDGPTVLGVYYVQTSLVAYTVMEKKIESHTAFYMQYTTYTIKDNLRDNVLVALGPNGTGDDAP